MADLGSGLGGAASGAATGAKFGGPIGAGIGGIAGGLLGLFGAGSQPEYHAPTLNAGTGQAITDQKDVATRGLYDWEKINNAGVEGAAKGMLPSAQQQEHESAGLGMTSGDNMRQAINNKYSKAFDADAQVTKNKGYTSAFDQRNQAVDQYNATFNRQREIETAVQQKNFVSQMQYQSARNTTIAGLFSSAGSMVGQMAAGGKKDKPDFNAEQGWMGHT